METYGFCQLRIVMITSQYHQLFEKKHVKIKPLSVVIVLRCTVKTDLSDLSPVFDRDDIFIFWMAI